MTLVDLRPGLRTYLLADGAISSAVGGERVYSLVLPQGQKLPSIVYSKISNIGDHHMQGPSGLARPRMQIDCYALTQDAAVELAQMVKERMDGFQGDMDTVNVLGVFFDLDRDLYDDPSGLFRVSQDYLVWFRES